VLSNDLTCEQASKTKNDSERLGREIDLISFITRIDYRISFFIDQLAVHGVVVIKVEENKEMITSMKRASHCQA